MLSIYNKTPCICPKEKLENILFSQTDKEVELIITDNNEIQEYNKNFRDIDTHTDVLSFPLADMPTGDEKMPLGSIVISCDYVKSGALEYGHREEEELSLLFIHALLHLLGYDHENDNGEMREKEASLIKEFALPKSLIVRV